MIIKSLTIIDSGYEKTFNFSSNFSLVYSDGVNSVGKTTLLRCLVYCLGYSIPSTKNFDFEKKKFLATLLLSNGQEIVVRRDDRNVFFGEMLYSMPAEKFELHKLIWEIERDNLLKNLLGVFYVDQEKGWTLLNRGIVIGKERFNIKEFVLALSNRYDENLMYDIEITKRTLAKYKRLQNVVEFQRSLNENNNYIYETDAGVINKERLTIEYEKNLLEKECKKLKNSYKDNERIQKFITNMRLRVKDNNGNVIAINKDNIVGYNENQDLLNARIHQLEDSITVYANQLNKIEKKEKSLKRDLTLLNAESIEKKFDQQIMSLKIDPMVVDDTIKNYEKRKNELEKLLDEELKINNGFVDCLHTIIYKYSQELGVDEKYVTANSDYIFTNKLAGLSGAILQKIVFCFKLAYIKVIEEHCACVLPIILDSPSGKEMSKENVIKMYDILKRDFSNHQIIVASIYDYGYADCKIELKERLMEGEEFCVS